MFVSNSAGPQPATPKRVLLTNDDGPDSPFFYPFAERLKKLGRVAVFSFLLSLHLYALAAPDFWLLKFQM